MSTQTGTFRWIFCAATAVSLAACGGGDESAGGGEGEENVVSTSAGESAGEGAGTSKSKGETVGEKRKLTPEERKRFVDGMMQMRARQQAAGLGGGSVEVNGAWNYTGYSYLQPDPAAAIDVRLVAVDVTLSGHTRHFDIDDIEIVDGDSGVSYGSDPHATPLTLEGERMAADRRPPAAPKASRWLLVYAYPQASSTFHLDYWGNRLTPEPVPLAERGMELPYPETEE